MEYKTIQVVGEADKEGWLSNVPYQNIGGYGDIYFFLTSDLQSAEYLGKDGNNYSVITGDNIIRSTSTNITQIGSEGCYIFRDTVYRNVIVGKLALTNEIPPEVEVVIPTTNSIAGKAADAKTVGDALYTGFTKWELGGSGTNAYSLVDITFVQADSYSYWDLRVKDSQGDIVNTTSAEVATPDDVYAEFPMFNLTASRHLITPTKTSQLVNNGDGNFPFATTNQIPDATLYSVYGGDGDIFSEWAIYGLIDGVAVSSGPTYSQGESCYFLLTDDGLRWQSQLCYEDEKSLSFHAMGGAEPPYEITATRKPLVGYSLGSQTNKVLQPQGDYITPKDIIGKLDSVAAFPAWEGDPHIYQPGDVMSYSGRIYRAKEATQGEPPEGAYLSMYDEITLQSLFNEKANTADVARATSQMWIDTSTSPATTNFNQNFVPLYHKQYSDLDTVVGNGYYGDEDDTIRVYNTAYGILLKDPSQTTYSRAEDNPNAMWGAILDPTGFSFNRGASQASVNYTSWSAGDSGDSVSQKTTNYIVPWLDLMRVSQPLPTIVRPVIINGKISNEEDYIKKPVSSRALYRGLRSTWVNGHRLYSEGETTEDLEYHYYTTIYGTDIPQSTNSPDVSVGTRLANVLDDRVVLSSNSWRQTDGAYVMKPIAFNRFSNAVLWGDPDVSRYILLYQNSTYHYLTQMPENSPSEFSVATCAGTIDSKEIDFGEYGRFRRTPLTETETIHSIYSDQLAEVVDGIASDVTDGRLKVKQIFTEDGRTYLDATGTLHRITVTGGNSLTMSNAVGIAGYTVTYTNIPNAQIPAFQVENAAGTYESAVRNSFGLVAWSSAQSKWLGFSEGTTLSYLITNYGEDLSGATYSSFTSINVTSPLTTEFEFGMSPAYWPCYIPQGETTTSIVNTVLLSDLGNTKIVGSLAQGYDNVASGQYSHAEGTNTTASGRYAHAEGYRTTASGAASKASGLYTKSISRASIALGTNANATNAFTFVWNTEETGPVGAYYGSHGAGTFNINPKGGIAGFFIGEDNLHTAFYNALTSSSPVQVTKDYEQEDGTTNTVMTTLPSLREAVENVSAAVVLKPSDPLCGWSLPEYVSALQKYEWDSKAQVCYRREVTNDYIILKAVTNIDLTAAGNITALKAYEDSILVRKPPRVTGGYTVGYPSDSDKIVVSGGDYKLEGDYLDGASVRITYEVSGTPTTETIPDSAITTTVDTITIASSALANARSNGGTVTFSIQTAYGSTTATAVVASVSP